MDKQSKQYRLLKAIIDKELQEIDTEMATLDNSDIASVVEFHINHGIRDVEQRMVENQLTELECPYGTPDELIRTMNQSLLKLEALLQYYYRACYFGNRQERETCRKKIFQQLDIELLQ